MAFSEMKWEYSDVEVDESAMESEYIDPVEGPQYLCITSAKIDEAKDTYVINFKSLTNEATFRITYFLTKKDSPCGAKDNMKAIGTVISLGIALAGKRIGLPRPDTIVGGVVLADVKLSDPNDKGRRFANIYKFDPVPKDLEIYSKIGQYYIGDEVPQ